MRKGKRCQELLLGAERVHAERVHAERVHAERVYDYSSLDIA